MCRLVTVAITISALSSRFFILRLTEQVRTLWAEQTPSISVIQEMVLYRTGPAHRPHCERAHSCRQHLSSYVTGSAGIGVIRGGPDRFYSSEHAQCSRGKRRRDVHFLTGFIKLFLFLLYKQQTWFKRGTTTANKSL